MATTWVQQRDVRSGGWLLYDAMAREGTRYDATACNTVGDAGRRIRPAADRCQRLRRGDYLRHIAMRNGTMVPFQMSPAGNRSATPGVSLTGLQMTGSTAKAETMSK